MKDVKKDKFDIGLVCMLNYNIGNNLCNYALYRYLTDLGYSVVLIATTEDMEWHFPERQRMWMSNPYPLEALSEEKGCSDDLYLWNQRCRFFIVGSDQTFRYKYAYAMKSYTYLEFVDDGKYKASYASSLGIEPFEAPESEISEISYYLNRFNRISVRERSGQDILRNIFGIESECVLDPIFLCDIEIYQKFIKRGRLRLPNDRYTFAYILDDSADKEKIVKAAADTFTDGIHVAMLERLWEHESNQKENLSVIPLQKNEEWIAGIYDSNFVVTDSFHCVCFCILFHKQFCVMYEPDNWRGWLRIENILNEFGLMNRHVKNYEEFKYADFKYNPIDYDTVQSLLDEKIKWSRNYLKNVLSEADNYNGNFTSFDKSRRKLYELNVSIRNFWRMFCAYKESNDRKMMEIKSDAYLTKNCGKRYMNVVAWGAGDCFHRNIPKIQKVFSIKYVCDNNRDLWDTEIHRGVKVISPRQLMEFHDCFVVIMIDNAGTCLKVVQQLMEMGITKFDHIENWLREIGEIQ